MCCESATARSVSTAAKHGRTARSPGTIVLNQALERASLSTTPWQRDRKQDAFYRKAKSEGYRARSAYKLQQLNDKFRIIRSGDVVVDLGAAPGGWTQVVVELIGDKGIAIGVDLDPIKPVLGATFIRGDMTKDRTVEKVLDRIEERAGERTAEEGRRVDVVVSDMSPHITGNYSVDQARSAYLCGHALDFAEKVLRPGGNFVAKIFEGEDFGSFRDRLKERFRQIKTFSPPASRKESSEVYLVAKGFRVGAGSNKTADAPKKRSVFDTAGWDEDPTDALVE